MKDSYFMRIRKKRGRRRLIIVMIWLTLITLAVIGGIQEYYDRKDNPTLVTTNQEYDNAVKNNSYIKIKSNDLYDLNVVMNNITTKFGIKTGEHIDGYYVAMPLENKIIPIYLPPDKYEELASNINSDFTFVGQIFNFADDDLNVIKSSLMEGGLSQEQIDNILPTTYLDYTEPIESIYTIGLGALFILLIVLIKYIPIFIKNKKALTSLINYSNGNLQNACENIDIDLSLSNSKDYKKIKLTPNYIIVDSASLVLALPLNELVWAYKLEKQRKIFHFIPIYKSYSLELIFSDKNRFRVKMNRRSDLADRILEDLDSTHYTITGYSSDLHRLYKKNHQELIRLWKANKDKYENIDIIEM